MNSDLITTLYSIRLLNVAKAKYITLQKHIFHCCTMFKKKKSYPNVEFGKSSKRNLLNVGLKNSLGLIG